jgi:hypothetical protein
VRAACTGKKIGAFLTFLFHPRLCQLERLIVQRHAVPRIDSIYLPEMFPLQGWPESLDTSFFSLPSMLSDPVFRLFNITEGLYWRAAIEFGE